MIDVTVLISTSPRPSHPSTRIIDQTIASVRSHLPEAPIHLMCDGANPLPKEYVEFIDAVRPRVTRGELFGEHKHQSGMIGFTLERVTTPLILYVEDDWEFYPDIEWDELGVLILSGEFNYIKFHAAPRIHPLHERMMRERVMYNGEKTHLIRTVQWSQNPHLASTAFYREINEKYLAGTCDYIENILAGVSNESMKLGIYNPVHGDMIRIHHLDGDQP